MAKPKRYRVSDGKLVLTLEVAEEGGYVVTSPDNPDVLTQAETLEEAFENARDVIALFKEERTSTTKTRSSSSPRARRTALIVPQGGYKVRAKPHKKAPKAANKEPTHPV
jgi:antitoxin HicB